MFQNEELQNHLETSFTVSSQSVIIAELNMNISDNIQKLGNYRYRKDSTSYNIIPNYFDINDPGLFYTGATDADVTIELGLEEDETTPSLFTYKKDKEKLYYSLEDCVKPFRPRSGINKSSFFNSKYFGTINKDMFKRPRYYMPHRDDEFKYWRSYRTENSGTTLELSNKEYGVSKANSNGYYFIDDTAPFIVYKESVPANRIVIKVQTNVGDVDLGPFRTYSSAQIDDPFYGEQNKTTPVVFDVQYLTDGNEWVNAASFNTESTRKDGSPIFGVDGHLSLSYGLKIPEQYLNNFILIGQISSLDFLPTTGKEGDSYLFVSEQNDAGTLCIYNGLEFINFKAQYEWSISEDAVDSATPFVTDVTNPPSYNNSGTTKNNFREFKFIKGIRIVVKSMNMPNIPFELIEMSPRLEIDISSSTESFSVAKSLSDLSSTPLPVGQVQAATGSITLFDELDAFNSNNIWTGESGSIIAKYLNNNIKFKFYEMIKNVNGLDYIVPIKTLYSNVFPKVEQETSTISIELRDFYFYLESVKAPQILLTEVSLGQAIGILLDYIGFSNYTFYRLQEEKDPVIPFFFIAPDQNVAEVLNQLAVATQTAMFFDEYNNFSVMTKRYLLDNTGERPKSFTLYGSANSSEEGINKNVYPDKLTNIIDIASQDQKVLNSGSINYTTRYIQRSYGTLKQSQVLDQEKTWVYKPVLLWEVSGTAPTKSLNNEKQQKYVLSAMPLNKDLSANPPIVSNNELKNNIIDFGENIYYISRLQGYIYANAEIIKYDAVQYAVSGTGIVWISSNIEYQDYFSKLPFNGKIYPTGLVRIYVKPYYETVDSIFKIKNGEVVDHGRGQFGTPITEHLAGISSYWTSREYSQGCTMDSSLLYSSTTPVIPSVVNAAAGISTAKSYESQRNGIIKNFLSSPYQSENSVSLLKTTGTGTVQSSALVFRGPAFTTSENARNFISYSWKKLDEAYKHIGTRLRITGKVEAAGDRAQTPSGGMPYYTLPGTDPAQPVTIGGGSGGIAVVNPATNVGYYFEIAALTSTDLEQYSSENNNVSLHNVLFYKVQKHASNSTAIPTKLWGGNANILVDDGNFTGQYRFVGEENPTVYDLSIEYVNINASTRVFYLYLNQKLINIVTDRDAIPMVNSSIGLFVRGSSRLMFENVYALSKNYSENSVFDVNSPISNVFDEDSKLNATEALSKYALSGMIQKTYLSGINPAGSKAYNMYYEEFGTIMREAAYFNIKYDKAYPALSASIAPTFNRMRGYSVSGFMATSYGAEFLIFNNTDTILNLDETTGNYLRILGIAFTQDTTQVLTVDDYFKKRGNLSNIELSGQADIKSPYTILQDYNTINNSRIKYGKNEFSLESPYIQDSDTAEDILGWIIDKSLYPRKSVGVNIFPIPTMQLGDIVTINYKTNSQLDVISSEDTRFVVYNIEYSKNINGPSMTIYLSEV